MRETETETETEADNRDGDIVTLMSVLFEPLEFDASSLNKDFVQLLLLLLLLLTLLLFQLAKRAHLSVCFISCHSSLDF